MKQLFALLITLTFSALVLAQAPADLVLVNGKIWTVDDKRPEVEAVAVLGNRIAAVGSTEEIRKWIGANTKVIDLQGKRVTPGLQRLARAFPRRRDGVGQRAVARRADAGRVPRPHPRFRGEAAQRQMDIERELGSRELDSARAAHAAVD